MDRVYLTFNYPGSQDGDQTPLTGVRNNGKELYISGFYHTEDKPAIGFVYKGEVGQQWDKNRWHTLNVTSTPGKTVKGTNLYGPDIIKHNKVRVVGSYNTEESSTMYGCLYEGDLNGTGKWTTLMPPNSLNTVVHSNMKGLAVGNYLLEGSEGAHSFIYNIKEHKYYDITKEGVTSISAYGIWYNGCGLYTICGGYSKVNPNDPSLKRIETAYLVDWNNKTHKLHNWREYNYNNHGVISLITHFEGITTDNRGGYNVVGEAKLSNGDLVIFAANINKGVKWEIIQYPGSTSTTGNSIYEENVIGVYRTSENNSVNGYLSIKL
jgi:hypothetical protein